jgi:hypothetical protein
MGRSARQNAGGKDGTTRRQAVPRPSNSRRDDEEGPATVRNILPWRNMEKELAKRLAEKAAKGEISQEMLKDPLDAPSWRGNGAGAVGSPGSGDRDIEPAPDSGVRHSSADGVEPIPQVPDDPHRPLTYSVYTASEIEAVRQQRMSMVGIQVEAQPSNWVDVRKSLAAVVRAFYTGYVKAKPRPRLRDVCQVPAIAFFADLRAALSRLPWKKIGWIATVAGGAMALLLFTVITVAELTDDLKPTRPEASASASASAAAVKAPPPPAAEPPPPAASNEAPIELDDDSANATPAPAAAAPAPAAAKPKPKASAAAASPAAAKPKPKASSSSPKPSGPQFNP